MNVYEKLNAAREEFHGLELKKTGHNKFAGYYYFELGDFLIPALKVFKKNGLCGIVTFEDKIAMMSIRNVEKPDEFIVISSPMGSAALKGCHEVQNIGAVETYQRRYLWVAALEIVEHDAIDGSEGKAGPTREEWLAERKAEIFSATSVGGLKAFVKAAIEVAMDQNDSAAVDQINQWAEQKAEQAKK